ncbi:MAG: hypothetical protein F6J93_21305 [Oscillatoria sp. SIO1A7]|nr:hypothetical protein [Oscillatoria sp. SIO1A7]
MILLVYAPWQPERRRDLRLPVHMARICRGNPKSAPKGERCSRPDRSLSLRKSWATTRSDDRDRSAMPQRAGYGLVHY